MTRIALTSALLMAACADKGSETTDSATTGQTDTTPGDTTGPEPTGGTTGPDPTGDTTGPDPTSGTTAPEPTTGDPVDSVYEQCKANNAEINSVNAPLCECLVASGIFPNPASCLADPEFDSMPEIEECTCMVYGKIPESKARVDCLAGPSKTFADCIAGAGCTDDEALKSCFNAYSNAAFACPAPPLAIQHGIAIECNGATPFMCGSGEQVPEYSKCDFLADCMDGSDEAGCPGFMCKDGTMIPLDRECDGFADCRDMSDEQGCPVFMCMSGEQIPESWKCDGAPDCMDGSDEVGCPVFMCMSGEQIPESWKCDNFPDCADMSDEANCP